MKRGASHLSAHIDTKRQRSVTGSVSVPEIQIEEQADKDNVFTSDAFQSQKKPRGYRSGQGPDQESKQVPKIKKKSPIQWGTGRRESNKFVAKAAPFDVFVCNTHNSTTEETIKEALMFYTGDENGDGGVVPTEVECRSREGMYRKSWRVQVSYSDKEKVLEPNNWPAGWGVRQYFRARTGPGYKSIQPSVQNGNNTVTENSQNGNNTVADKIAVLEAVDANSPSHSGVEGAGR